MTWDSIDSRPMRVRRCHSRSTSFFASSGRSSASSLARSSLRLSSADPPSSPSSFWIAFICSRRYISRWRPPSSSLTFDWMSSCAESTSIWRWTWTRTRRRRSSTDRVSSSTCFDRTRDVEVAGHEVGEPAGLVHLGQDLLDGLVGQPELLPELGGALARLAMEPGERRIARVEGQHLACFLDGRFEEAALVRGEAQRDAAGLAFEDQADAAEAPLHGADRGDGPDRVELGRRHVLRVGPLGHREDLALGVGQGRLDRAQSSGAAGRDRERHAGEKNRVPHRNDGKDDGSIFGHRGHLSPFRPRRIPRSRGWRPMEIRDETPGGFNSGRPGG